MDDSTLGLGLNNPQYQDLITKQQEAIKAANQPYGMDAGQGAIAAGLGLLPALIGGLVRGKEGLSLGAQAGMAGVSSYDNILKENFDRKSKAEAANAALYGQQAQQLAQSALQDQRFLSQEKLRQQNRIELREMFPNKGTNVTVNNLGNKQGEKIAEDHYDIYQSAISTKFTNDNTRSLIDKLKKEGASDNESYWEALARSTKGKIVPSSTEGKLESSRIETMLQTLSQLVKGAPSDRDSKLLEKAQQMGGSVDLSTIKEIADRIDQKNVEKLQAAEGVASDYGVTIPELSAKLAGGRNDNTEEIDFDELRNIAAEAKRPIVKKMVGGKPVDVYDLGEELPIGQRYIPVGSK